jgi:hypothetical protein
MYSHSVPKRSWYRSLIGGTGQLTAMPNVSKAQACWIPGTAVNRDQGGMLGTQSKVDLCGHPWLLFKAMRGPVVTVLACCLLHVILSNPNTNLDGLGQTVVWSRCESSFTALCTYILATRSLLSTVLLDRVYSDVASCYWLVVQ